MKSIEDVIKTANRGISKHWFSQSAMEFFDSIAHSTVYPDNAGGAYFITSERQGDEYPRLFSVRYCTAEGEISTIGDFQGYYTRVDAEIVAKKEAAFNWKRDIPIWALLHFHGTIGYQFGCVVKGWKATPKGGKITIYDPVLKERTTWQIYK